MFDRAEVRLEDQLRALDRLVELQLRCETGNQQGVIDAGVDGALEASLDFAEVEHHGLVVQLAVQFHVHDPALADQAARGIKNCAVDDSQVFDEKAGHKDSRAGRTGILQAVGAGFL